MRARAEPAGGKLQTNRLRYWFVFAPLLLYAIAFWFVEITSIGGNVSAPYLIPATFITGIFLAKVDRREFVGMLGRVRVEFCLLLLMVLLCLLSLFNSAAPFRAFRILFPCALPFLLFLQLVALRSISPRTVEKLPRLLVYLGFAACTAPLFLSMFVPGLAGSIFTRQRLEGFLENPNQLSVVLGAMLPLMIAEIAVAKRLMRKLGMGFLFLLLVYTLLRTGSKTALAVGLFGAWVFYFLINFRSYGPAKRFALTIGMAVFAMLVLTFGLQVAEKLDPELGMKLRMVVSDGVGNYYSIESRKVLWEESILQGKRHWLVGSGAGQIILGNSHSHNLVLDYFRGIGLFGAVAVVLLCLMIMLRATLKAGYVLSRRVDDREKRIFACYAASVIYVLCNQLSDCFGPSTIGALWLFYLPAVMAERPRVRRVRSQARRPEMARTLSPQPSS